MIIKDESGPVCWTPIHTETVLPGVANDVSISECHVWTAHGVEAEPPDASLQPQQEFMDCAANSGDRPRLSALRLSQIWVLLNREDWGVGKSLTTDNAERMRQ